VVTSTLCTLDHNCRQASVALAFGWDEDVSFSLAKGGGAGPVSLTGYLQPSADGMDNEDDMYGDGESSDEDDEEEEEEEEEDGGGLRRMMMQMNGGGGDDDSDDEEEEDEESDDGVEVKRKRSFDAAEKAKKKKTKKAPEPAPQDEESSEEESDDEELDAQSKAYIKSRLEQFVNEEDRTKIKRELERLPPSLNPNVKKNPHPLRVNPVPW